MAVQLETGGFLPAGLAAAEDLMAGVGAARAGTGLHVMATLGHLVISILRLAGHASIAVVLAAHHRNPSRVFRLLTDWK